MPSLGADMESGTISKWLVAPGDEVHRGDVVAVIETEKSNIEVEIFENGVIGELLVPEGQRVPVGTPLARVLAAAPVAKEAAAPAKVVVPPVKKAPVKKAPPTKVLRTPGRVTPAAPRERPARRPGVPGSVLPGPAPVLSPVLRRLAKQLGVDLTGLRGSGPGGLLTREDVEHAAHTRAAAGTGQARSSPLARRRAAELGVDVSAVQGTGPGGSVVEADVRRAAAAPAPVAPAQAPATAETAAPATGAGERQAALRHAIGALMARSKREIPHYYLSTTIDVGAPIAWLEQANLERPVESRLVLPALLLKATALAVKRVPEMNGFYVDDAFSASPAVHVGVAVSLRSGGVIAPAVHDVDRLDLDGLMRQLKDLVGRARRGILRSSEMSDPTITVTNLGDLGVEAVFGVIYPPQVALVGFGRVVESPFAESGMLGVRSVVTATLSADHRVSDGHRGGRFLSEIDRLLQEPEKL